MPVTNSMSGNKLMSCILNQDRSKSRQLWLDIVQGCLYGVGLIWVSWAVSYLDQPQQRAVRLTPETGIHPPILSDGVGPFKKTVFRCLSSFVVGSSLATKLSVFGGKFVPSVHNNWVEVVRLRLKKKIILYSEPIKRHRMWISSGSLVEQNSGPNI